MQHELQRWESELLNACLEETRLDAWFSSAHLLRSMARKKASEPEEPEKVKLAFSQSLKSSNTGELLKRLKSLHKELAEIDQDAIETSSLDKVAKELISNTLLLHKEKAVKAFLATCLVDILRLYAPEPPYTNLEVRVRLSSQSLSQHN